ncbi:MAG: DEAD/DEAH box helicase [Alphaproteobacteria bacterium]
MCILTSFDDLGLNPTILKAIEELGYTEPSPIQQKAIPLLLERNDIMGLAQTGTGKTAAFGLPLIQHLFGEHERAGQRGCRALILAPTRELANQIADNMRSFVKRMHLRVAVVVGGQSISTQMKTMSRGTDILVATPGRLLDLVKRRAVFLDQTKYLVLDEADQMLDLGFIHALREISKLVGKPRQTMLFSATMAKQMEEISRSYLTDPVRVQVASQNKAADKVSQSVHFLPAKDKTNLLKACLTDNPDALSLVFARTKHGAEKLMLHLVTCGFKAGSIHGNKSQSQRDRAIREFKAGDIKILVATDVAARGIDISGVTHVYNYELPDVAENYVHRIGRTARAGAEGEAIAFCGPNEMGLLRDVERLMRMSVRVASGKPHLDETAKPKRGGGGGGRGAASGGQGRGRAGQGAGRGGAGSNGARPNGRNQRSEGPKAQSQPERRASS